MRQYIYGLILMTACTTANADNTVTIINNNTPPAAASQPAQNQQQSNQNQQSSNNNCNNNQQQQSMRPGTYTTQTPNGPDTTYTTGDKQPYIVDNNCNNNNTPVPFVYVPAPSTP